MCKRIVVWSLFAFLLVLPARAGAAPITLFNNFGPGNSYYTGIGASVDGATSGYSASAMGFRSLASGSVSEINLALSYEGSVSYHAVVSLWTNVGGSLGTELGSWTVTSPHRFGDSCCGYVAINGISGVNLVSGGEYFLVATPVEAQAAFAWNLTSDFNWQNPPTNTGARLYSTNGTTWTAMGPTSGFSTFQVLGTDVQTVPDPASALLLFGTALSGIAAARRKWR